MKQFLFDNLPRIVSDSSYNLSRTDSVADDDATDAMEQFTSQSSLAIELKRILYTLPGRERDIVGRVLGVCGRKGEDYDTIAERFNISK